MQAVEEEAFLPVILMENVGGVVKEVVRTEPRHLP
jgi:hypothetical protein